MMAAKPDCRSFLLLVILGVGIVSAFPLDNSQEDDQSLEDPRPTLYIPESTQERLIDDPVVPTIYEPFTPSPSQAGLDSIQEGGEDLGSTPTQKTPVGEEDLSAGGDSPEDDQGIQDVSEEDKEDKTEEEDVDDVGDEKDDGVDVDSPDPVISEGPTVAAEKYSEVTSLEDIGGLETEEGVESSEEQQGGEVTGGLEIEEGVGSSEEQQDGEVPGGLETEEGVESSEEQQDGDEAVGDDLEDSGDDDVLESSTASVEGIDDESTEKPEGGETEVIVPDNEDVEEAGDKVDESGDVGEKAEDSIENGDDNEGDEQDAFTDDTSVTEDSFEMVEAGGDDKNSGSESGDISSTAAYTTSGQQDDTSPAAAEVEGRVEPVLGRVVEKDDSVESASPTPGADDVVGDDDDDIGGIEKSTSTSEETDDDEAVVGPTVGSESEGKKDDDEVVADDSDSDIISEVEEEVSEEVTNEDSAPEGSEEKLDEQAGPTQDSIEEGVDSDRELSVQTREDKGGLSDKGTDDSGEAISTESSDEKTDGKSSEEQEGNVGKVVTLDELEGDAKNKSKDDIVDDVKDGSSEEKTDVEEKILDLEEAERRFGSESSEEGEEGSGSADEVLSSTESKDAHTEPDHHDGSKHDHSHGHGENHGEGHGHASHQDTSEDNENKKRTAIIVGVALGGAALLTLGVFTTRQCKQKAKFTPLQKAKEQDDPEAIEFRPVGQTGTALDPDDKTAPGRRPTALDNKNGLFRHGPSMGPPSPRFHRKTDDGKFKFPDSPTAGGKLPHSASPAITPLLGQSPAENGQRGSPNLNLDTRPAGGPASGDQPANPDKPTYAEAAQGQPSQSEGLYRHGPRMGPPSPRMHRKTEGKFDFLASSATTPSPSGSPLPVGTSRI
ncbi:hypothetical protein RRG08_066179 [Elysia crispata]|uniref:Uncharacterized protein n=1 Tax=Elysia crispata TaxID=231223 RepID=A0AAE1D0M4_9GAST|nr:hypothetical protein RRG08_066179 [Elysia crispata]